MEHREIGKHTLSDDAALRAALRHDPDVILVGEMRDLETISTDVYKRQLVHSLSRERIAELPRYC